MRCLGCLQAPCVHGTTGKSDGVSSVMPHGRTKVGPAPHEERSLTAAGSNGPPGNFPGLTRPRPHPHISVHESHPENRRSSVGSYELGLLPRRVRSSVARETHKKILRAPTSAQQSPVRNAIWRVFGACSWRRDSELRTPTMKIRTSVVQLLNGRDMGEFV